MIFQKCQERTSPESPTSPDIGLNGNMVISLEYAEGIDKSASGLVRPSEQIRSGPGATSLESARPADKSGGLNKSEN